MFPESTGAGPEEKLATLAWPDPAYAFAHPLHSDAACTHLSIYLFHFYAVSLW